MKTYSYTKEQAEQILSDHPGTGFTVVGNRYLLPVDYVNENGIQKGQIYEYELKVESRLK